MLFESTAYVQTALTRDGKFTGGVGGSCGQETGKAIEAYLLTVLTKDQLSHSQQKLTENPCNYVTQAAGHLWQRHGNSLAKELGFSLLTRQDVDTIDALCNPEVFNVVPFEGYMRTLYYAFNVIQFVPGDEVEPEHRCIIEKVGELIE